ncbi:MAG: HDOD domain-containing protein, partial [Clostridiales bacterium]|nr:HDOD domain-containing protein [Clostridiales bacterium]
MGSYVARQPIFTKNLNIYGYELLYRIDIGSTSFYDEVDPDTATSEAIMNTFHEIGIDRITNGKRAFVNFTKKLLLDQVATILPHRILVIEILENILPTPDVLEACRLLKKKGYILALDDFNMAPENMPFLDVADIVKIDFLATPPERIKPFIASVRKKSIKFLAEKLETYDDFEMAKSLGFTLFQGYFFCKPVIVSAETKLTPMQLHRMQLIALSFDPNINYTKIMSVIKQDIALSFRLFRVVNSAYFGLKYTVHNIRQALAILGMDEIKKWITLISMSELKDDKPNELITMSLVRARFME